MPKGAEETKIWEKSEALEAMKGNWTLEAAENNAMKAQISQLRKDIAAAESRSRRWMTPRPRPLPTPTGCMRRPR